MSQDQLHITIPKEMPNTGLFFRHLFGTHKVACQTKKGYTMEAALLGLEYVRILLTGASKLPVLTLVGNIHCGAGLLFYWLEMVCGKKVVPVAQLQDMHSAAEHRQLTVYCGRPEQAVLAMAGYLNNNAYIQYGEGDEERRVPILSCFAIWHDKAPIAEQFTTPHWVRKVPTMPWSEAQMLKALQGEHAMILKMLSTTENMLTTMSDAHWFAPDLIAEPLAPATT